METLNLIDTFSEFKELKNIDRATMMTVLEDVFRGLLVKRFETDENLTLSSILIKVILRSGGTEK